MKTIHFEHNWGKVFSNWYLTAKWLTSHYIKTFRANPNWSINGVIARVKSDFGCTISFFKAWRKRELALKALNGDESDQYRMLHDYKLELLRINPGSSVIFKEGNSKFQGMYICLSALKEAFKDGCRPFVCLDCCWLKGIYERQLLSAVAIIQIIVYFPLLMLWYW